MKTYRILVTGWRGWPEPDKFVVWQALNEFQRSCEIPAQFVVVHGQCEFGGADLYAEQWAVSKGHAFEAYPARRVNGRILGPERNAQMVKLGADVCLGFPGPGSRGTVNCMKLASKAGIPTRKVEWFPASLATITDEEMRAYVWGVEV